MLDDPTFLRVINANPDDDGPRLLYADYLDEKGDATSAAHAEFIRVQCALNAAGPGDGNVGPLRERERALLNEHWRAWLRPACQALAEPLPNPTATTVGSRYTLNWIPGRDRNDHCIEQSGGGELPYFRATQFRRGFLAHAALYAKASRGERHVARLWDKAPIDGLTLAAFDAGSVDKTLAAIEPVRLRSLELIFTGDGPVASVASRADLGGLRELFLVGIQGRIDVADLIGKSTTLAGLRTLILEKCTVDEEGVARLCHAPFAASLERLDFVACGLTDQGAIRLAREFPGKCRLTHMDITGNHFGGPGYSALRTRFGNWLKSHTGDQPWPRRFYL